MIPEGLEFGDYVHRGFTYYYEEYYENNLEPTKYSHYMINEKTGEIYDIEYSSYNTIARTSEFNAEVDRVLDIGPKKCFMYKGI